MTVYCGAMPTRHADHSPLYITIRALGIIAGSESNDSLSRRGATLVMPGEGPASMTSLDDTAQGVDAGPSPGMTTICHSTSLLPAPGITPRPSSIVNRFLIARTSHWRLLARTWLAEASSHAPRDTHSRSRSICPVWRATLPRRPCPRRTCRCSEPRWRSCSRGPPARARSPSSMPPAIAPRSRMPGRSWPPSAAG